MAEKDLHIKNIELRSEEIEDVLGRPPKRIVRWGITVVFVIFAILFTGSWFVKYPDVITSAVEVTSQNPPAYIEARVGGKLDKLFVEDKQYVDSGAYLAIIENPANYEDVFELKNILAGYTDFLKTYQVGVKDTGSLRSTYILGEMQSHFSDYIKEWVKSM